MTDSTSSLSDLIDISRDGMTFYEEAAQQVGDAKLSKLFKQLAQAKSQLVEDLSNEVAPSRKRRTKPKGWVGEVHEAYIGVREDLPKAAPGDIARLEEAEGRLQVGVHEVTMDREQSFVVRVLAKQYLSKTEALQRELRARKRLGI